MRNFSGCSILLSRIRELFGEENTVAMIAEAVKKLEVSKVYLFSMNWPGHDNDEIDYEKWPELGPKEVVYLGVSTVNPERTSYVFQEKKSYYSKREEENQYGGKHFLSDLAVFYKIRDIS